jgi:hypothetical protein
MNTPSPSLSENPSLGIAHKLYKSEDISVNGFIETVKSLEILDVIIIAIAVYLAMKCKNNGNINFVQIILAILFAPCFIFYRILKPCI